MLSVCLQVLADCGQLVKAGGPAVQRHMPSSNTARDAVQSQRH